MILRDSPSLYSLRLAQRPPLLWTSFSLTTTVRLFSVGDLREFQISITGLSHL